MVKWCAEARRSNWLFGSFELLQHYDLAEHWDSAHLDEKWNGIVFNAIKRKENEEWLQRMQKKDKLRTYRMVKTSLTLEPYLANSDGEKSVYDLFRLRCGTNCLRIETGRYEWKNGEKLHASERECKLCQVGEPETEEHFLLHCPVFSCERAHCFDLLGRALDGILNIDLMSDQQRLQLLLLADCFSDVRESIVPIIKAYIARIYLRRQKLNCLL